MTRSFAVLAVAGILVLAACTKKESTDAPKANPEPPATVQSGGAPHAVVHLNDGSKVQGQSKRSLRAVCGVAGKALGSLMVSLRGRYNGRDG